MYLVVIALILLAFAFITWRDFKFALTLLFGLLPTYLVRFELGVPWTLLEGFILILFAFWFWQHHGRHFSLRSFGPYRAPLFLLLALACFSAVWAPNIYAALGLWKAYFIEPVMVFAMLRATFLERKDWQRALSFLSVSVLAIALFAVIQKITGYGIPIPWDAERRITSFFDYPNAVGLFIAPIIAALFFAPINKWLWWPTLFLGSLAILFAETEAALVAIPFAILLSFLVSKAAPKRKIALTITAAIASGLLFFLVPVVREKLLLHDYSGQVRLSQWRETIALLKDKPLQGAGLSGYPTVFENYHDPALYEIFQYPHNVFLNFWVELGLFGVVAFVWLAVSIVQVSFLRRQDTFVLAAFCALVTMFIHGLVDVPFFKNDLAILTSFFLAMTLLPEDILNGGKKM